MDVRKVDVRNVMRCDEIEELKRKAHINIMYRKIRELTAVRSG